MTEKDPLGDRLRDKERADEDRFFAERDRALLRKLREQDTALSGFACPPRHGAPTTVQLAHGGGGRRTRELVEDLFLPAFDNPMLAARHDSAVVDVPGARLAITTDSYVVSPLFFPGGDIGTLAVCGTVNDLAMAGARPLYLTAGFILEEGLPLDDLGRVVASMRAAARAAGVTLVAGDIKVVDRGKGDGMFINTAGVGVVGAGIDIGPRRVRPGDAIVLSGDLGRHGVAIMSVREGLRFETAITSDCAPVAAAVEGLLAAGIEIHCLRDLTRGGLATALNEIALDGGVSITVDETRIPVTPAVVAACEILGLDPLYVANEGRFIAIVPEAYAARAIEALRASAVSAGATRIGTVEATAAGRVSLRGALGVPRVLDLLTGEQLPRIC
jgi:hydrogenase expression/formation protein HypE